MRGKRWTGVFSFAEAGPASVRIAWRECGECSGYGPIQMVAKALRNTVTRQPRWIASESHPLMPAQTQFGRPLGPPDSCDCLPNWTSELIRASRS